MPASYASDWETLPIQCQQVPGVTVQPEPDPTTQVYVAQVDAEAARTALVALGVPALYYGVYKRFTDSRYQLWPDALRPLPGLKVS